MREKITKKKIIIAMIVIAVLAAIYWWGGNAPGLSGNVSSYKQMEATTESAMGIEATSEAAAAGNAIENAEPGGQIEERPGGAEGNLTADEKQALAEELSSGESSQPAGSTSCSQSQGMKTDSSTVRDQYMTDPVPEGKPIPIEPQNAVITDKKMTCTFSIKCDTILSNISWLDPEKVELVPADGVIMAATTVEFFEGESVFNVLLRETKKNKIHMEYENTPIYNSAYIEGIHNLYEFDCGELSGWMYKVNGWFPNYGCSRYQLKQGDTVEWVYTCDLSYDVGGGFN